MKYGILTYHNIPNIGAILQAQALCEFIRSCGYDCDIIDYTCKNIVSRELTFHPSSNLLKNIFAKFFWRKTKQKIKRCDKYEKSLNILSSERYERNNICKANEIYDVFISGSDIIWNLDVNGKDYTFFLDFVKEDKPRLAFASSIGAKWTDEEKQIVLPLLKEYQSISVREEDTNEELNIMGIKSHHLLDPTLLIDSQKWRNLAQTPNIRDYVLVYFPTKELVGKAKQYAKTHSLKVVVISNGLPKIGVSQVWPKDPREWLGLFKEASAVFTNSFHGLLFSFYFEKAVWTANYGNRINSILESLDQRSCRLDVDGGLNHVIDYKECNCKLTVLRERSQNYIINTLLKCKER